MTYEESLDLSARIGSLIASRFPKVEYTPEDVERAKAEYTPDDLDEMREIGILKDDFEEFYVIREFTNDYGIGDAGGGEYLLPLFARAKKLDAEPFRSDPYLQNVTVPEVREGDILLTNSFYERGEIFQYEMPDLTARTVTPSLGFFNEKVTFPAIYEGDVPWVSVCPSELSSMAEGIQKAHGRVLVLGLGLGYYLYRIAGKENVSRITVVDLDERIIKIVKEHLLPQFPGREKITLVHADALDYLKTVKDGDFDYCYADIWEGVVDGAAFYRQIEPHEKRLSGTEFDYWIKEQILSYLKEVDNDEKCAL